MATAEIVTAVSGKLSHTHIQIYIYKYTPNDRQINIELLEIDWIGLEQK